MTRDKNGGCNFPCRLCRGTQSFKCRYQLVLSRCHPVGNGCFHRRPCMGSRAITYSIQSHSPGRLAVNRRGFRPLYARNAWRHHMDFPCRYSDSCRILFEIGYQNPYWFGDIVLYFYCGSVLYGKSDISIQFRFFIIQSLSLVCIYHLYGDFFHYVFPPQSGPNPSRIGCPEICSNRTF